MDGVETLSTTRLPAPDGDALGQHTRDCLIAADRLQRAVLAHELLAKAAGVADRANTLSEADKRILASSRLRCVALAETYRIVRTRTDWRAPIANVLADVLAEAQAAAGPPASGVRP